MTLPGKPSWRDSTPVQQGMGCILIAVAVSLILLAMGAVAYFTAGVL